MRKGFLVGVVLCLTVACASVDSLNVKAERVTRTLIAQSETNRCTVHPPPCLSDADFKTANLALNKVAVAGREFTQLSRAGKASAKDVTTFLATVASVTADLAQTFTTGAAKSVLDGLTELQAVIGKILGKTPPAAPATS